MPLIARLDAQATPRIRHDMTPDVNVLIAASRADHPHHKIAKALLTKAIAACAQGATLYLMPMVVASFLRLSTNAKIFVQPMPMQNAMAFLDALLAIPGVEIPALGAEWPLLRQLCIEKNLAANDTPDAWLAAAAMHLGEHVITFDAGFKRLLGREQVTVLETN